MTEINAGTAGVTLALTSLLIIYVVFLLWGFVKRPRAGSILEIGILLGVMYVGWTIRTWPTRQPNDAMLMSLGMAWRDSVLSLLGFAASTVGLDQAWDAVWGFVAKFFQ